ncbi:IclR family transcriptional regulator [Rhodococcus sp. PAM 2766]|uniref:IclR family transcriptional regulator n=1 Tax=Rhodococcus parequi TaxID=3137122 RepID=A0ABW9FJI9_9NOCA
MTTLDQGSRISPVEGGVPPSMVDRMTVILDAFGGFSSRVPLEELARRTRLPRSTVHRILDSLLRLGWVEHSPGGYHLGPRLHRLGGGEGHHGEIRAAAAPVLNELHHRTGMIVHLGVLENTDILCLDRIGARPDSPANARVGGRVPAHATAAGKAILAGLVPEQVDLAYGGEPLRRCTDRTIADLPGLHRDLGRARARRGVTFARGESSGAVACVGAPVRVDGGTVAAVSLCGPLADAARLERCAPLVLEAGRAVAAALTSSVQLMSA